jgi:putative transcriptional regulator
VAEDRPIDALLAAYAARTLPEPLEVLVESHLEMKAENRGYIAALDAAFGVFLADIDPVPLTGRDRRLVNIFASRDDAAQPRPSPKSFAAGDAGPKLPAPLRRFVGCELAQLSWRKVGSGIEQAIVADGDFGEASFLRCRPGKRLRVHGHTGLEAMLVLKGAFKDGQVRYETGDLAVTDESRVHQPVVDLSGELICYMVSKDKVQAQGPIARMLDRMFGR